MKRFHHLALRAFAIASLGAACASSFGAAVGTPFVANNYKPGGQYLFGAAAAGNGDSLLLWQDSARGGYFFVQRYDGSGVPLQSDEWYLGPNIDAVAMDRWGNFAVTSIEADGNGKSLYVTVYKRDGSIKLPKFKANSSAETGIFSSHIALNAAGQMAVSWGANRGNGTWAPLARSFSPAGIATSPQVTVAAPAVMMFPQGLAIDGNGNFGVAWATGTSAAGIDTYFQRYTHSGSPQTSASRVNTYTLSDQVNCAVAMSPAGDTIVTWESTGQDSSSTGIYGQRFNSNGIRQGGEFRVNDSTAGAQTGNQVTMSEDGSFLVSWYSDNRSNVPSSTPVVYLRQYGANGTALGAEVPLYAPSSPQVPSLPFLATDPAGNALIGWRNYLGSNDTDVYAQRFTLDNQAPVTPLSNSLPVTGLGGATGSWSYFKITVPAGRPSLTLTLSGPGTGNADLYGRLGGLPSLSSQDVLTTVSGNNESIVISGVPPGTWYFGVYGTAAYSGVSLTASY